jgi:hypothetical protein
MAGGAGGACGWVARVTPRWTEQPLAPDTGERGWGVAAAVRYCSPVQVKRSVRPHNMKAQHTITLWYDKVMPELARFLGIIIRM